MLSSDCQVPPFKLDLLVDVLKLSTVYLIDNFKDWSIYYLDQLPTAIFTHALRFNLSLEHRVLPWLEPSFRALAFIPLSQMTDADVQALGLANYHRIMLIRELIEQSRRLICSSVPPATCRQSCVTKDTCRSAWRLAWYSQITVRILHPDSGLVLNSQAEMVEFLEKLEIKGMHPGCRETTVRNTCGHPAFGIMDGNIATALSNLRLDYSVHAW